MQNGVVMDFLENIEQEVADAANQMAVEVVLLLIDKWERDLELAILNNEANVPMLLNHYVRLKISLHHVRKAWDRGWSSMTDNQFKERINILTTKTKEARRNYYVAKQRYKSDEHGSGCSCRGCLCIAGINGGSSHSVGQSSY
jgi:hypothetical protein